MSEETVVEEEVVEEMFPHNPSEEVIETGEAKDKVEVKEVVEEVVEEEAKEEEVDWKAKTDELAKQVEGMEKRLKDTQSWANKTNQEKLELEKTLTTKKVELGEIVEPSAEEAKATSDAVFNARFDTSYISAVQVHGEDKLNEVLNLPESAWQKLKNDPVHDARVRMSPTPVFEMMKIVQEEEFKTAWGTDPVEIEKKMRKKIEDEYKDKESKKAKKALGVANSIPGGLNSVKNEAISNKDNDTVQEDSTSDLFG